MRTSFGGSWILAVSMKWLVAHSHRDWLGEEIHTIHSPNMDKTFAVCLGSQCGDSDLTKDYGSVGGRSSADFDEVVFDGEVNKFGVRGLGGTRPHPATRAVGSARQDARRVMPLTSARVYPSCVDFGRFLV